MVDDKTKVWETVQNMNRCWTTGKSEELTAFFHKKMIAVTPTDPMPLLGQKACLASWKSFTETATIHSWRELEPNVEIHGDAAIVSYLYELDCEVGVQRLRLEGRDLVFLMKEGDKWWVVADQFSPYPKPGTEVV